MMKLLFFISLSVSLIVNADTLEPLSCCTNKPLCEKEYCSNTNDEHIETQIENTIEIQHLKSDLKKHINEFESHDDEIKSTVKGIQLSQGVIDSRTSELKDSMWNTINWMSTILYGTIGVGFAGGGIFIWRENQVSKARMEKELIDIKTLKDEANKQLEETVKLIEDNRIQMKSELACLRRRAEIDRLMDSKISDYQHFYPLVTYISQFPSLENLVSLKKLEKYELLTLDELNQVSEFASNLQKNMI